MAIPSHSMSVRTRDERHLDLAEQRLGRGLGERRPEELVQREHRGAVRAAVGRGHLHRHFREGNLRLFPFPATSS